MNSRMDRYYNEDETPILKSRTDKNKTLYDEIKNSELEKFDINSNATVIDEDVNNVIDVDKVRDMLDKQYRDDYKKRILELNEDVEQPEEKLVDTKEYDINAILEKARKVQDVDYEKERLKKVHDTQYDILKNLNINTNDNNELEDNEENITNLINTITALEDRNKNKLSDTTALDLLSDLSENETIDVYKTMELDKEKISTKVDDVKDKEDMTIEENYEDFKELQNDIKSNNIAIKIVLVIVLLLILAGIVVFVNYKFNLGLF